MFVQPRVTALIALGFLGACTPPPPAPEGLDASTSYLVRNFYADDATFEAGVQGFMDWFEAEGKNLMGENVDLDETEAFTVGDLSADDVAHLPLDMQIITDGNKETLEDRDMSLAKGVVSLAEMDCDWLEAEDYLVRPDQHNIFAGDWEGYDRTYVTPRVTFQEASQSGSYDRITETLDPFAEGFDPSAYGKTLLFTDNQVDPTKVILADMPSYPMDLDLRHGTYTVDGEDLGAFAILTYNPAAVWGPAGNNGLVQSYSIEINVQRPNDRTLRLLAVWAQPSGSGIQPDSPLALNYAVNKSLDSSIRLSEICAGEISIDE